jgi:BirA family transcriptional regulator, biotin operon repressor / biotin---[acetyl-CoA-carboxylase] ligase
MKDTILERLRQSNYVSGEDLGKNLGITRSAIWKYIKELRQEGYDIHSSPNKGYSFVSAPDILSPVEIKSGLPTRTLGQVITYRKEVTSTQELAKALAAQGAAEGTLVITEMQTEGRGRIGRIWTSLPGGIYLSIILRPEIKPTEAPKLPLVAGVAVAHAIELVTGLQPKLKWPNDIIIAEKKVGGILTEMSAEIDRLDYVIIGIGINVNMPRSFFPQEIETIATSLIEERGNHIPRAKLVQSILVELESLYEEFRTSGFEPIRQKWKALSNTIGAQVTISSATEQVAGLAKDIDSDGALILEKDDGSLERIIAGDVSLRKS